MLTTTPPAVIAAPPVHLNGTHTPAAPPQESRRLNLETRIADPAPPIQNPQSKIQDLPLSPHDESLLETILIPGHSIFSAAREHKLSLQALLNWWAQSHIKAALAAITDLGQARARALAARHSASAVCWLQSAGTLSDAEFYETADSKTRLRAFESARKAAGQLLRLAGLPTLGGRPLSRPRPSDLTPGCHGSSGSAASRAQSPPPISVPADKPPENGHLNGHLNGHSPPRNGRMR